MSDATGTAAAPSPETERRAREMGWAPKDQWRGAAEAWIDADAFLKRGDQIMPILQANNRKLEARANRVEEDLAKTRKLLETAQESIEILTNLNTDQSREAARDKRRELLAARVKARKAGDEALEIELDEQIETQTAAIHQADSTKSNDKAGTGAAAAASTETQETDPASNPVFKSWKDENPWFGVDMVRTSLATGIGQQIRSTPEGKAIQGRAFFDKVSEEVNKFFDVHRVAASGAPAASKVEGGGAGSGNGSGGGGGNGSGGKSYSDLPADAKQACDKFALTLVGDGRAFKTADDWRKHYTKEFFAQE